MDEEPRAGWMELKVMPKWPKRPTSLVMLPHYTVDQARFLEAWGKVGIGAFILAQIEDEFLLIDWRHANAVQKGVAKSKLQELATLHDVRFPTAKVLRCLTRKI